MARCGNNEFCTFDYMTTLSASIADGSLEAESWAVQEREMAADGERYFRGYSMAVDGGRYLEDIAWLLTWVIFRGYSMAADGEQYLEDIAWLLTVCNI